MILGVVIVRPVVKQVWTVICQVLPATVSNQGVQARVTWFTLYDVNGWRVMRVSERSMSFHDVSCRLKCQFVGADCDQMSPEVIVSKEDKTAGWLPANPHMSAPILNTGHWTQDEVPRQIKNFPFRLVIHTVIVLNPIIKILPSFHVLTPNSHIFHRLMLSIDDKCHTIMVFLSL